MLFRSVRALAPTAGLSPTVSATVAPLARPGHDAVPVLLVPVGGSGLSTEVDALLGGAFGPAATLCSSTAPLAGCIAPGFGFVFGGSSTVTDTQVDNLSRLVAGGGSASPDGRSPRLAAPFVTSLDMGPVFDDPSSVSPGSGADRMCFERNSYAGARWLVVSGTTASATSEVMIRGRYVADGDGVTRSPGVGAPVCVAGPQDGSPVALTRAVSLSGQGSAPLSRALAIANRFSLSSTISASAPQSSSGVLSETDLSAGGSTSWAFAGSSPVVATSRGIPSPVSTSTLDIVLTRGSNLGSQTGPDTFTGTFSLVSTYGTVSGTVSGEAQLAGGVWRLRGASSFSPGTWNLSSGLGGFSADVSVNAAGTLADDSAVWRLDGSFG